MPNRTVIALILLPLLGCFAQVENDSIVLTHSLCGTGNNCIPGGGASLSLIQVSGTNTFTVSFGDQPLLQPSTGVGPATLTTSLLLNQAAFDMATAGADFKAVTSAQLVVAPHTSTGPGDDPCAAPTTCPAIAAYSQATDGVADQHLALRGNGSDLVNYIDQSTHSLIVEIKAQGNAPSTPTWNADVSMDMALKSKAKFP
jgi:hypothetical protein